MTTENLLEKRFLLGNVIQIAVLTHADAFKGQDVDQYFDLLQQGEAFAATSLAPLNQSGDEKGASFKKNRIKLPGGYQGAWKKMKKENWHQIFQSQDTDGKAIPETLAIALREIFLAANPSMYYLSAATTLVGQLIKQHGGKQQVDALWGKLLDFESCGALALFEPGDTHHLEFPETVAVHRAEGHYEISGLKERVMGADHELTENIIYLLTARIRTENGGEKKMGLLAVPRFLEDGKKQIDNGVRLEGIHSTTGLKAASCSRVSFGDGAECRGYLLEGLGTDSVAIFKALNDWYTQLALQSVVQTEMAMSDLSHYGKKTESGSTRSADTFSVRINPTLTHLRSLNEGLRATFYTAAFYQDCALHGADSQKEYFSDLLNLYSTILTAYAPTQALDLVSKGLHRNSGLAYAAGSAIERGVRDLQTGVLLGVEENRAAEMFVDEILPGSGGRLLGQMLKQFETVDSHQVMSEALTESIAIWRDYIGGLIVLFGDIINGKNESETRISSMFAGLVLKLFGDVIVCYHLIVQGMEAERILAEEDANFYNLKQEVTNKPELKVWYNKLLLVEYFAVYVLSMQESTIRLIQRNPQAVLEQI